MSVVSGLGHSGPFAWRSDAFIGWTFSFDPGHEVLASLAQDEGNEVGTHNDRFYSLCECKALCDSNPSCNYSIASLIPPAHIVASLALACVLAGAVEVPMVRLGGILGASGAPPESFS